MSFTCRQQVHLPHIWPTLPLSNDHMIYSCEQYCQWCPGAISNLKRWKFATALRKHAKCHITKDSAFTIQGAGKGGRKAIVVQNMLVDKQALQAQRLQEAASAMPIRNQPVLVDISSENISTPLVTESNTSTAGHESGKENSPISAVVQTPSSPNQSATSPELVAIN